MIDSDFYRDFVFSVLTRLRDVPDLRDALGSDELNLIAYMTKHAPISSSQIFQDIMVLHELNEPRDGFFVEFGVCDGITGSNSYTLEKSFGWSGIIAEPNPIWHERLFATRSCFISTKCVHTKSGEIVRFNAVASEPQLSTINAYSNSDGHRAAREQGEICDVETISLHDLLESGGARKRIDYLSIDTEGSELDILNTLDFSRYDIGIITVEHNFEAARIAIHDLLSSNGYDRKYVALSMFDDWYIKRACC